MFIWMQKSIEFCLPHYEIPQLSLHHCLVISNFLIKILTLQEFCVDGGTKSCIDERIPSVERKKEQLRKATLKNDEL